MVSAVLVQRVLTAHIDTCTLCIYEGPVNTAVPFLHAGRRCRPFRPTPPGWLLVHGGTI